jgi:uncharacterized protein
VTQTGASGIPRTWLTRRRALAALGGGGIIAAALAAGAALTGDAEKVTVASDTEPPQPADTSANANENANENASASENAKVFTSGYAPDGTAGRTAALSFTDVALQAGPFKDNRERNTAYLLFLDPERMLRPFRINYGVTTNATPCGGWEAPKSGVRGHITGHLLSALAITYANTGNVDTLTTGQYLVAQLAGLQARAKTQGFNPGYLSAFPESYFDALEQGRPVWSPYYMIHKYLAGLIDQYQLVGNDTALQVAMRLGDWVAWRSGRLPYDQMQMVLNTEFGGLPEALANLYTITGQDRYLAAAQRFYHARVLDPLADNEDALAGLQANTTVPKIVACVRMWEETGETKYRDIAVNFWNIVTAHHTYIIGGASNHEHFQAPDQIATQLSNFTCENCVSYNMLKLTRLLHFHQLQRIDLIDYYERTLFNQMLGEQDPTSPHGFNCYYTGLCTGAFKRQPLNYFPAGDPDVYSTDYDDFTCDTATGMETQAKFADTIYSRDADGIYVNLFIPSQVRAAGLTLRQDTQFPDKPLILITTLAGLSLTTIRVRVPSWTSGSPLVRLNGTVLNGAVLNGAVLEGTVLEGTADGAAVSGGWVSVRRLWRPGDTLEVTLPMRLGFSPAPDQPSVQAVTYGPVVLSGVYADYPGPALPALDPASVRQTTAQPMTFTATADGQPVTLVPVARAAHEYYTVYWQTPAAPD